MTIEETRHADAGRHERGVGRPAPERADDGAHDWLDNGVDTHRGEYWYKCSRCGRSDWIASYGTMDQLMPRECKTPN